MKMRILILDDIQERHDGFAAAHPNDERVHVYTYNQACNALFNLEPFDVAYLDHDLTDFTPSGYMGAADLERTGLDVCIFLVREVRPSRWPERVVIHSWNPEGARHMKQTLRAAGIDAVCQPFDGSGIEFE